MLQNSAFFPADRHSEALAVTSAGVDGVCAVEGFGVAGVVKAGAMVGYGGAQWT